MVVCGRADALTLPVLRVNCGAPAAFTDSRGRVWQRDRIYAPGKTLWGRVGGERADRTEQAAPGETIDITGTDNPGIYRCETYGSQTYLFATIPGPCRLRLHFAETYTGCAGPGYRVFDVYANGRPLLERFDVFRESGGLRRAIVREFDLETDGELKLQLRSSDEPAILNAIELEGAELPESVPEPAPETVALQNDRLRVRLDAARPVVRRYELFGSGLGFDGCVRGDDEDVPLGEGIFTADARRYGKPANAEVRFVRAGGDSASRWYDYAGFDGPDKLFEFRVEMSLKDDALIVRVGDARESAGCEFRALHFPRWRPLCVTADTANAVVGVDNDLWPVDSAAPRVWRNTPYALLAADRVSASVYCNAIDAGGPLEVSVFDTADGTRATGIGPHTWRRRSKDRVLPDFEMRIGVVADYNRDGRADWVDAANWLGDQIDSRIPPVYAKSHINKYFLCKNNQADFTLDQVRERMVQLYHLTNGAPHIVYLVGWQYEGHDSEYPAMDVVNEGIGGRQKLLELMRDAPNYNFNFSFHFNYDDAYPSSPDWDPAVVAVGGDGQLVKGGIWSGNQSYILSPYKLVKSGTAQRMTEHLLSLYPLRDTIHLDVLSAVPYRTSDDPDDPSDAVDNLVLGKFEIMRMFEERGIDVTSEWASYPFIGRMTYYYHAGLLRPNTCPLNIAALHGKLLYGGWIDSILTPDVAFVPEYLTYGAMADNDYRWSTPLTMITDIEYLLGEVGRLLNTRRMTGFLRRGNVVRADYGPGTWVEWNSRTDSYEAHVDGALVSKDFACIVPTHDGWIIYSRDTKRVEFPLPKGLVGKRLKAESLSADGTRKPCALEIDGDRIAVEAEGHVPYLVCGE